MKPTNYFLRVIAKLRMEEVVLNGFVLSIPDTAANQVVDYLEMEYLEELLEYPFQAPDFDPEAALWAAKTMYIASQLLMYRENQAADLASLFPTYQGPIHAAASLSVDLTLRFLPDLMQQLSNIDPEDALLPILQAQLQTWHYSGIGFDLEKKKLSLERITTNPCWNQLYINRVIERKDLLLAQNPILFQGVQASLGIHQQVLWKGFEKID